MAKIVQDDTDCAECLCRVCARNKDNDVWSSMLMTGTGECNPCSNCFIGETEVVVTTDDCPKNDFLAEEEW